MFILFRKYFRNINFTLVASLVMKWKMLSLWLTVIRITLLKSLMKSRTVSHHSLLTRQSWFREVPSRKGSKKFMRSSLGKLSKHDITL